MPPSVLQRDIFSFNSDKNRISLQSTYDNINMDTSLSSTQSQILGEPVSAEIYSIVDTTKDSFNFLSTLFKLFSSIHSNWSIYLVFILISVILMMIFCSYSHRRKPALLVLDGYRQQQRVN